MRRPRHLSAEERALWDSVAKQAKPLRKKRPAAALASPATTDARCKSPPNPDPSPPQERGVGKRRGIVSPPPTRSLRGGEGSGVGGTLSTESVSRREGTSSLRSVRNALERRERTRLKRGQRDIDARLDLHGMTQARAHRALLSFLQRAQDDGCRYVLIITGKGKASAEATGRGVLRRLVPEWFGLTEFRMLVVGYAEAGIGHGGEGALYVRVRRG